MVILFSLLIIWTVYSFFEIKDIFDQELLKSHKDSNNNLKTE